MSLVVTEHYALDVPRLTRIVHPEEHKGKLIQKVTAQGLWPDDERERCVVYETDQGEVKLQTWAHVKVEHGPEREAKMRWARSLLEEPENTDHELDTENNQGD